jgi:hypothetical protein
MNRQELTGTDRNRTGTDRNIKETDRNRQEQTGTDRNRQEHTGTDRKFCCFYNEHVDVQRNLEIFVCFTELRN